MRKKKIVEGKGGMSCFNISEVERVGSKGRGKRADVK